MKTCAVIQVAQRSAVVIRTILTGDVAQRRPAVIDSVLTGETACATEFSPDGN